ncbi:MAG TPA: anthranilate phosphoribosyltransferase [Gemmatimonadaceae bacterium]|jgi:anthranilate phosphoribosyltransferase|nr:anthranilate phosphoribosyltransferase [Gemmatimonadaceae bacterium]
MADPLRAVMRRLAMREAVPPDELTSAFDRIMAGEATPTQVAAVLMGLRVKGETAAEVAAVVRALRRVMVPLAADAPGDLVDTCGTGGGTVRTFNISTAAALVAAGGGARIAKHGNRSFTTQCGSADVLEALGVRIDVPVAVMEQALRQAGIVFMFAPLMHPAMRHVGPVRRELGVPTVMNIVGPLANPAHAGRQVIGAGDADRAPLLAGALAELGTVHALVVHGAGMDEISPLGPTEVREVRAGEVREWVIDPTVLGLGRATADELAGGSPAENAAAVLDVLQGRASRGATAAVLLNAAAALYVAALAPTYEEGLAQAEAAIRSGAGLDALERLRSAFARPS